MALNTQWANKLIADLQRDFGLSLGAAQGITGALAMESKGFTDWQEDKPVVAGSRGGGGMAQWTGPRRVAYENFVAKHGLELDSYEAQYGYLREELKGVGGHDKGIIKKLKDVTDPATAAQIFTGSASSGSGFLRPGIVHMDARYEWTNQVVSNYHPVPPGELNFGVGSKLDVAGSKTGGVDLTALLADKTMSIADKTNIVLDSLYTPYPESRAKGTAARTNAALKATEPVSLPPKRPERDPTTVTNQPTGTRRGNYEYAPNGEPRDPDNGFLMDRNDPRYAEAMGIKVAPTPRPASERPAPKPVARLPELGLPSNITQRAEEILSIEQSQIERTTLPTAKPVVGQSQIERGTTPKQSNAVGGLTLRTPTGVDLERQEKALLAASDKERGITQPTRPTPEKKPGVTRVGTPLAGQVALPAGVRPLIPSTEVTRLPEILPGGSNPTSVGFTHAGQEGKVTPKPTTAKPGSAQANIESAKAEQQATRQNLERIAPIQSLKLTSQTADKAPAKNDKKAALPPLEGPISITTPPTVSVPSKHKPAAEAQSLNDSVTDMMRGFFGVEGRNAQQTTQPEFMGTITLDGITNYSSDQKSQGYGSKGYSEQYSPGGTHRFDSRSGNWVPSSASSSSSSSSGSNKSSGKKK